MQDRLCKILQNSSNFLSFFFFFFNFLNFLILFTVLNSWTRRTNLGRAVERNRQSGFDATVSFMDWKCLTIRLPLNETDSYTHWSHGLLCVKCSEERLMVRCWLTDDFYLWLCSASPAPSGGGSDDVAVAVGVVVAVLAVIAIVIIAVVFWRRQSNADGVSSLKKKYVIHRTSYRQHNLSACPTIGKSGILVWHKYARSGDFLTFYSS